MSWIFFAGFSIVQILVIAFLFLALARSRHGRHLNDAESWRLVLYGGIVVPSIVLVALLIYSVSVGRHLYAAPYRDRGAMVIHIEGSRFWWDVKYMEKNQIVARTANEIHIPVGQPVVFKLDANDVIHSFWVPALAGKLDLIPGRTNHMWAQADRPGIYRGQCAEYCGAQHAHMGLEVVAEAPADFARWLDFQKAAAIEPSNEQTRRGQQVFLSGPCALCHAIRGTSAFAEVGPELTHLAGRRTLAAATMPNNRGSLAGWIVNAQGIKPGSQMPRITLAARDLEDLTAYLGTLK
jgi:cytochrome c oxidase subunit 2